MPIIVLPRPGEPEPHPQPSPSPAPRVVITKDTPFRQIPGLPSGRVREILTGYPMENEAGLITLASGGSALALAQSFKESQYGKTAQGHNPLGLMQADGHTLGIFPSWAAAFLEWRRRMDDPTYKGGVYMPIDMPLSRFIRVYVAGPGPGFANGETPESVALYLQQTIDRLNRYFAVEASEPIPAPAPDTHTITMGRVPRPANFAEHLLAPNGPNTAWDNLGARIPRGIILHRMQGTLVGTDIYFAGEARNRALTDFGIGKGSDGRNGRIVGWIEFNAHVAPYASGPADGIDGDGTAFWNRYKNDPIGVNIFNRDCRSIEIEGFYADPVTGAPVNQPVPPESYQALVQLVAWLADGWLRIPHTRWPLNNDGVHCLLGHSEVTNQKPCPGPVIYGLVASLITDVRATLKQYQEVE